MSRQEGGEKRGKMEREGGTSQKGTWRERDQEEIRWR